MTKEEIRKLERKVVRAKRFAAELTAAAEKFEEGVVERPGTKRTINAEARIEKIRRKYEGVFDIPDEE